MRIQTDRWTWIAIALGGALAAILGRGLPASAWGPVLVLWVPLLSMGLLAWRRAQARPDEDGAAGGGGTNSAGAAVALAVAWLPLLMLAGSTRTDFFYLGWWPASASWNVVHRSGLFRFAILTAALIPLLWFARGKHLRWALAVGAALGAAVCVHHLMSETGGAALYRDDHPSFMFRFWAFARSLPSLAYYSPFWNGGRVETASISSGVPALGVALWPIWRFIPVHLAYTPVVGHTLAVLIPALAVVSVRMAGGGWNAAAVAAVLALGSGRMIFLWTLHFGTVPSGLAAACILPVCGAVAHILKHPSPRAWSAAALALGLAGMASWPPGAVMAVPAGLAAAVSFRDWTPRRFGLLAAGAAGAVLLLLPGWLGVLTHTDISGFVAASPKGGPGWPEFVQGLERLRLHLWGANPILVGFGIAGVACLRSGTDRRVFGVTIAGLAVLAGWGVLWNPELQLQRAGIPMLFAAVIPAALWAERLLAIRAPAAIPLRAALLAAMILSVYATSKVYRNLGPAPYSVFDEDACHTAEWIRETAPEESRVLFAGSTVHGYARGHVAYLPVLTGRSMMACDYYHFSPAMVEYDYPPKTFRSSEAAVFEFFDLYNVSTVLTFHDKWKRFFRNHPDRFEETGAFGTTGRRVGFRLLRPPPGWFLRGSGEVRQEINALRVRVDDPGVPVVLRFNWVDDLRPDAPAVIRPYDAGRGVKLIELDPRGRSEITLRWNQWRRGTDDGDPSRPRWDGEAVGGS